MIRTRPLCLESLEHRLAPASFGVPWPVPQQITISFVPDGTLAGSRQSELFDAFGAAYGSLDWQAEILRAAQTWAEASGLNVAVVADSGLPLGTAGAVQDDARFGDLRVAGYPMGDEVLAIGSPFDPLAGTHSGDLKFNTSLPFGPDGIDLYSVALHELGHAFGLDHSDDPDSVMYEVYLGVSRSLTEGDVAAIQTLYGERPPDAYDLNQNNDTVELASGVTVSGPQVITADLGVGDVDHYAVRVPGHPESVTFRLRAAGLSLLVGEVAIYDEDGNWLAGGQSTHPGGDVELSLSSLPPGGRFVVVVSAGDDVFRAGTYSLEVVPAGDQPDNGPPQDPPGNGPTTPPVIPLQARTYGEDERFAYFAEGETTTVYRFLSPAGQTAPGPLTVFAWSADPAAPAPRLTLLDANGGVVAATLLVNQDGTYVLQLASPPRGTTFLLRVESTHAYSLGILFGGEPADLQPLFLDEPLSPQGESGTLFVAESQLMHFVLSADGAATLQVIDEQGEVVGILESAEPVTTTLYLRAGTYRVHLSGEGSGSVWVAALSNPIGPDPAEVRQTPQPLPPGTESVGYWWERILPSAPPLPPSSSPASPPSSATPTSPTSPPGSPAPSVPTDRRADPVGRSATPDRPVISPKTVQAGREVDGKPTAERPVGPVQSAGGTDRATSRLTAADGIPAGLSGVWTALLIAPEGEVGAGGAVGAALQVAPAAMTTGRLLGSALNVTPSGGSGADASLAPEIVFVVPPVTQGLVLPPTELPRSSEELGPSQDSAALVLEQQLPLPDDAAVEATVAPESEAPPAPRSWVRQFVALVAVVAVGILNRGGRKKGGAAVGKGTDRRPKGGREDVSRAQGGART